MSVQKRVRNGKTTWVVRYRVGDEQPSRTFDLKRHADKFDAEMKLQRRHPQLAAQQRAEKMTLKQYVEGPWRRHAATFEQPTRDKYRWALETHLAGLANEKLIAIDVERVGDVQAAMLEAGATASTVREVLAKLAAILEVAISQGYLAPGANPVKSIRRPPAEKRDPNFLEPAALEAKIASLSGRDRAIAILGGRGGLSPKEIKLVRWADFDGERITVGASRTKDSRAKTRTVKLDQLSRQQLKEWRLAAGRPGDDEPIIGAMTHDEFRRWHLRHLPAGMRLTDLRHSHASALHHTKMSQPAILARLGHGIQAHYLHYVHVINSIDENERYDDLEALYADARGRTLGAQQESNHGL